MGFQAAKAEIETLFKNNWTYTEIAYEGVPFDDRLLDEWVRISIADAGGKQASCGIQNVMFRYVGNLFVQIFIKNDKGSGRAMELADLVTPIFRSKIVNGIHYGVPEAIKVGPSEAWFQVNVSCEFYREEFQS
jgi:hypothetical protein